MFRTCFGHVPNMFWACLGHVSGMFRACFEHVSDMFRTCFGHVSAMFRTCFGHVSDIFRTCFRHVSDIIRDELGMVEGLFLHRCSEYRCIFFPSWNFGAKNIAAQFSPGTNFCATGITGGFLIAS